MQILREDGYAVDEARDGVEGHWKAKSVPYDAVVLDLMLPKKDGFQVLSELRREGVMTPVLVLTARDALADRVRGLDGGADDYLTKPFDHPELLARVRALIRRSKGKASGDVVLGNVTIDTVAKLARKDGEVVALTAREYALVEMLALHRGELVSRSKIYEHIFDEEEDSLSNLIDVHVSNIRRKLGKDFITTRRGQGYVVGETVVGETRPEASEGQPGA